MKPLPEYILNLFNKCIELKEGEILTTSFGPDNNYDILKKHDHFTINQTGNYWRRNKIYDTFDFANPSELFHKLKTYPYYSWYAQNVFIKKDIHFDNIVNFCNAFKKILTPIN